MFKIISVIILLVFMLCPISCLLHEKTYINLNNKSTEIIILKKTSKTVIFTKIHKIVISREEYDRLRRSN